MCSIKVKFRPSLVVGRQGVIFYQIIHDRRPRQFASEYKLFPSEWDESNSSVIPSSGDRGVQLDAISENISQDVARLERIASRFVLSGKAFSTEDIIAEYRRQVSARTLFTYMEGVISRLKINGKKRTSETYSAALHSFKLFRADEDIALEAITPEIIEDYQAWHVNRGNSVNTASFYLRILRAVYNRAVEDEIVTNCRPFRHVYTGTCKTVKRALPIQLIRKINHLKLVGKLDYARDIFILSFMLRGMSFIDMAYLRKSDLINGYIVYRRRKTGQLLTIKWTKDMQQILDKYPADTTQYLLPIIRKNNIKEYWAYRNAATRINCALKIVAKLAGIAMPLSMYVARHSWASAAKCKGVPISVISQGMGHDSEATTQIYLASLDTSVVDNANSLILKSI